MNGEANSEKMLGLQHSVFLIIELIAASLIRIEGIRTFADVYNYRN